MLNGDQYQSLGEKIAMVLFMYVKTWDASKETLFYLAGYLFCSSKSPQSVKLAIIDNDSVSCGESTSVHSLIFGLKVNRA